jgi:hypothetical protein
LEILSENVVSLGNSLLIETLQAFIFASHRVDHVCIRVAQILIDQFIGDAKQRLIFYAKNVRLGVLLGDFRHDAVGRHVT